MTIKESLVSTNVQVTSPEGVIYEVQKSYIREKLFLLNLLKSSASRVEHGPQIALNKALKCYSRGKH